MRRFCFWKSKVLTKRLLLWNAAKLKVSATYKNVFSNCSNFATVDELLVISIFREKNFFSLGPTGSSAPA